MQREQLSADLDEHNEESTEEATDQNPIEANLTNFSYELLVLIFIELPTIDITHLALVCSHFYTIVSSPFFLKEKIKKNLEKKDSLPDWAKEANGSISTLIPLRTREPQAMEVLSSCLHHPGPDLENLRGNFPTLISLLSAFTDRSPRLPQIPWFFRSSPKRVFLDSSYQEGLNYLYTLVSSSISQWEPKIIQPDRSYVLMSRSRMITPYKGTYFSFIRPGLRAILFNQPYTTLLNEKNNGCVLSQEFYKKDYVFTDDEACYHSPICFAVSLDNLRQVQHLVQLGVSLTVNIKMKVRRYGSTSEYKQPNFNLVNLAAYYKHHSIVHYLLKNLKGSLDITETCWQSYIAEDLDGLECLLECGIDIDFKILKEKEWDIWEDFLQFAQENNRIFLIKKIHQSLGTFDQEKEAGILLSLLNNAATHFHFELFNILLTLFNDPPKIKKRGKKIGRKKVDNWSQLEAHLKAGVPVNLKKLARRTTLANVLTIVSNAVGNNCIFLVRELLALSTDDRNKEPFKELSMAIDSLFWLHEAAQCGYTDMVSLLLLHGARVNEQNGEGNTALKLAINNGHLSVVKILVKNSADPQPELIPALFEGQIEIADYLFETMKERGQSLSSSDRNELGPVLMQALIKNQSTVIEFLNNKIFPGRVAIDWNYLFKAAILGGQLKLAKLYIEKKYVDVHTPLFHKEDPTLYSPLTYAITFGCKLEIVWYLLKNGAPVFEAEWEATHLYSQKHSEEEGKALDRLLERYSQQQAVNTASLFYHSPQTTEPIPLPKIATLNL